MTNDSTLVCHPYIFFVKMFVKPFYHFYWYFKFTFEFWEFFYFRHKTLSDLCFVNTFSRSMSSSWGRSWLQNKPFGNDRIVMFNGGGSWLHAFVKMCRSIHLKSRTRLSDFIFTFHFHVLEKEMATHSSVLAWGIPGVAEPGGLPSMGSHRVGHDWSDLAAVAYT